MAALNKMMIICVYLRPSAVCSLTDMPREQLPFSQPHRLKHRKKSRRIKRLLDFQPLINPNELRYRRGHTNGNSENGNLKMTLPEYSLHAETHQIIGC